MQMSHSELYINKLNGSDLTPPSLVNFPLLDYCYKKNKETIINHDEANKILGNQQCADCVWGHSKLITTPKYIFHVDFDLFTGGEYPNLLLSMIATANAEHRNITTSIHIDLSQPESYYLNWCRRLDKFLLNNEKKQVFDYLNIYINANEVELADAWLNSPVYSSYSNVFDVIRLCSSIANLIKVNVLIVKQQSPKTGRPVYDNILNSRFGLGWPLNLYNKRSEFTLVLSDDGKTAYIKNIHIDAELFLTRLDEKRTFDKIEFDSRMTMLPNASKISDTTKYSIQLSPNPRQFTWIARLLALLPWLRSYVSQ